jgi:hypothetical protein
MQLSEELNKVNWSIDINKEIPDALSGISSSDADRA